METLDATTHDSGDELERLQHALADAISYYSADPAGWTSESLSIDGWTVGYGPQRLLSFSRYYVEVGDQLPEVQRAIQQLQNEKRYVDDPSRLWEENTLNSILVKLGERENFLRKAHALLAHHRSALTSLDTIGLLTGLTDLEETVKQLRAASYDRGYLIFEFRNLSTRPTAVDRFAALQLSYAVNGENVTLDAPLESEESSVVPPFSTVVVEYKTEPFDVMDEGERLRQALRQRAECSAHFEDVSQTSWQAECRLQASPRNSAVYRRLSGG